MKKRNKILFTLFALILLLSVIAVTYAYFSTTTNNSNAQSASVQAGTMQLTFADNDAGVNGSLGIGESITKKFTISNTGSLEAYAKMNWYNLVNTYTEGSLTYTIEYAETLTGTYTELVSNANVPRSTTQSTQTLVTDLIIPVGKTYYYNLIITLNNLADVDQTADLTASMSSYFTIVGIKKPINSATVLANLGLKAKSGTPNFDSVATTDETADGLYAMKDDYGTSYYFRGAVTNNYVKFGKWNETKYLGTKSGSYNYYNSLSNCRTAGNTDCSLIVSVGYDMYWRIIRINGDGSIRMIYDGTQANTNGTSSLSRFAKTQAFNPSYDNNAYVGYMYGSISGSTYAETHANTNSSTIKTYLEDTWYKKNIVDSGYSQYISDEIFCNDRSLASGTGTGTSQTHYGAYNRLYTNKTPQLTCPQKNDAFTVDDTEKGNGTLTYPVGLITADEISLAGGRYYNGFSYEVNKSYYLYKFNNTQYWTMTPTDFSSSIVSIFSMNSSGGLESLDPIEPVGVAPVINISPEYALQMTGSGTASDPYILATGQ